MHERHGFCQQDSLHPLCTDTAQITMNRRHRDARTAAPAPAMPHRRHRSSTSLSIRNVRQRQEEGRASTTNVLAPPLAAAASATTTATQLHHVFPSLNDGGSSDDDSVLAEIEHRIHLSAARGFARSDDSDGSESDSDPEDLVPPHRNNTAVVGAFVLPHHNNVPLHRNDSPVAVPVAAVAVPPHGNDSVPVAAIAVPPHPDYSSVDMAEDEANQCLLRLDCHNKKAMRTDMVRLTMRLDLLYRDVTYFL